MLRALFVLAARCFARPCWAYSHDPWNGSHQFHCGDARGFFTLRFTKEGQALWYDADVACGVVHYPRTFEQVVAVLRKSPSALRDCFFNVSNIDAASDREKAWAANPAGEPEGDLGDLDVALARFNRTCPAKA